MAILDFLTSEFIDVIEWTDDTRDTMVWRFETRGNAIKYGALSVPEGEVAVCWALDQGDGRDRLRFHWAERGGPPVEEPARRGFGTRLIGRGLSGDGRGSVDLRFRPDGVECDVIAPLDVS